jgi:hypothetical protein
MSGEVITYLGMVLLYGIAIAGGIGFLLCLAEAQDIRKAGDCQGGWTAACTDSAHSEAIAQHHGGGL